MPTGQVFKWHLRIIVQPRKKWPLEISSRLRLSSLTHDNQRSCTETELISSEQSSHNDIKSSAKLSICLNDHSVVSNRIHWTDEGRYDIERNAMLIQNFMQQIKVMRKNYEWRDERAKWVWMSPRSRWYRYRYRNRYRYRYICYRFEFVVEITEPPTIFVPGRSSKAGCSNSLRSRLLAFVSRWLAILKRSVRPIRSWNLRMPRLAMIWRILKRRLWN